ncbi:MAG: hypothetical protein HLX51_01590 [Micrococcaceae bacterium]|nr:hypothetical protein [Micrococcaceae bacterium]
MMTELFDHTDPQQAAIDICTLDATLQREAIEQWLVVFDPWVKQVAAGAQTAFGRGLARHKEDDIIQITRMAAWQLLEYYCDNPDKAAKVVSLRAVLRLQIRNNVRDEFERDETKGVRGVRSMYRNARELDNLESEMAQDLHRMPTRAEVVAEWNARASVRKDARRQGRTIDGMHFGFHENTPPPMEHEHSYVEYHDEPDFVLMPLESQEFRDTVVDYAGQKDQQLGIAAGVWLDESQAGARTEHGIYKAIKLAGNYRNLAEAREAVEAIRRLSIVVLREHYGIDSV